MSETISKDNSASPVAMLSVDQYLDMVLSAVLRGAIVSLDGQPPQAVMMSACRVMATFVGNSFHGDLASVLMIRKNCKDAFLDAMAKAPTSMATPSGRCDGRANGLGGHGHG